jgi:hypothetical protein
MLARNQEAELWRHNPAFGIMRFVVRDGLPNASGLQNLQFVSLGVARLPRTQWAPRKKSSFFLGQTA